MTFNLTDPVFHDEAKARAFFESERWPDGPVCPYCGEKKNVVRLGGAAADKGQVLCRPCRKKFTVTVGTVMERSHIPLTKWLMAFRLMASSKKGISAHQMHRMMGVTYKTAWFLMHRIREAMSPAPAKDTGPLGGEGQVVESDETYVGGKAKNVHNGKPVPKKHPVVALVERGGKMRAKHVADVTASSVREVLVTQVSRKSELHTDDSLVYYWLGKEFAAHRSVNHSKDEYVGKQGQHVNSAESYFALLKRGIMGSFHSVSEQHLQRYADEFAFRWNYRKTNDQERASEIIKASAGRRLTYRRIDQGLDA